MTHKVYSANSIKGLSQFQGLSTSYKREFDIVCKVLPFKINNYVVENLIDWDRPFDDPIFNLTFLRKEMLPDQDFALLENQIESTGQVSNETIFDIRNRLNPDPDENSKDVPKIEGISIEGLQHKYKNVVILFPSHGQTCHCYCTFCFRWPQFVKDLELKYSTLSDGLHFEYIKKHKEINEVLITGGDPMIMTHKHLSNYIEPLLGPGFEHIRTIRIGSKVLTYWPQRFISDNDSDDILRMFERIVDAGKHLAFMAHWNHWKELETNETRLAIRRVQSTGALIRTQSPLLNNVNHDPEVWVRLWETQVNLGCIPYYMYVERLTGGSSFFKVRLVEAWETFKKAYSKVTGLCKTVRGPLMSTSYGKINIDGLVDLNGEKYFALKFHRSKTDEWTNIPFLARYNPNAYWFDELEPFCNGLDTISYLNREIDEH